VRSWGGTAAYTRNLLDGNFNATATASENTDDQTGQTTLGFSASGNYARVVDGWHVNGSFGYAQNVQTLLVTYMNSYYNYVVSARRRWGAFNFGVGAGQSHTGLTQQAGTVSGSESFNASVGYGAWLNATGSYARANGQALNTGAGLTTVPVPTPVIPSSLVDLYGGDSYSIGVASSPVKKLSLTASWARSTSNISSDGVSSANQNEQFQTLIQYQTRKLYYTSGYARLEQGFGAAGVQPQVVASYYIGISRWFNFF
jgi:hypothetical protein